MRNLVSKIFSILRLRERGFTVNELLITITIIGVLAGIILVSVDPIEQIAKARDSSRKQGIESLDRAEEEYALVHGDYLASPTFLHDFVNEETLKSKLPAISYKPGIVPCTQNNSEADPDPNKNNNHYCLSNGCDNSTGICNFIIFTKMESKTELNKCGASGATFYLWSSLNHRNGIVCYGNGSDDPWYACDPRTGCTGYTFKY